MGSAACSASVALGQEDGIKDGANDVAQGVLCNSVDEWQRGDGAGLWFEDVERARLARLVTTISHGCAQIVQVGSFVLLELQVSDRVAFPDRCFAVGLPQVVVVGDFFKQVFVFFTHTCRRGFREIPYSPFSAPLSVFAEAGLVGLTMKLQVARKRRSSCGCNYL